MWRGVTPDNIALNPARAVLDVDLCYRVGEVRKKRTRDMKRSADYAVRLDATIYPLSKLVYGAHCEQLAQEADNASLRSYLTGKTGNRNEARRYLSGRIEFKTAGIECGGCPNNCEVICVLKEGKFLDA